MSSSDNFEENGREGRDYTNTNTHIIMLAYDESYLRSLPVLAQRHRALQPPLHARYYPARCPLPHAICRQVLDQSKADTYTVLAVMG